MVLRPTATERISVVIFGEQSARTDKGTADLMQ